MTNPELGPLVTAFARTCALVSVGGVVVNDVSKIVFMSGVVNPPTRMFLTTCRDAY